ncbi:MAG: glycosyltransferase family 2 protein [Rhodospirillales bacterium]|nr:glycosyltransferase family 2 protein [Rhodospirillales bacterium]
MSDMGMRVAVVVASVRRAEEIGQLLQALSRQTKKPEALILSVSREADLPLDLPAGVTIVTGTPSLPAQRNRGLDLVQDRCDVVVFYDDDFLPAKDSLQCISEFFLTHPLLVGATGHLLADGINGPGLPYQEALEMLATYEASPKPTLINENFLCAYGCNMAFRCEAIGTRRFDENLPKYGWQEDMDFAGQLSAVGKVIRTNAFAGVHRGVKNGRGQGADLGFSQIVNPVYLAAKGTMTKRKAASLILRNLIANHVKSLWPEPYIDRMGRLRGNWDGILHILRGNLDPTDLPSSHKSKKRGSCATTFTP